MAILKKTAAFFTAVTIAACVTGCADTSYVLKADNEEIKAGVYIDYIYNEMSTQINTLYQTGVTTDFLNQKIDGKNFTDYVSEVALNHTKEHVAINNKFDELKLTLDDERIKEINSTVSDAWEQSGDDFEEQGISRESFKEVYLNSAKRTAIFEYYYAEGGIEEVSSDDLVSYVNDNYLRYKVMSFAKNAQDEDADKENKDLRDKYFKMADGLNFEEFDTVIDAYKEYQEEKAAESAIDSTVDTDTTESSEAEDSAADAESSMTEDKLSSFEAEGEDESAEDVSADNTSSVVDDESAEDDSSEAEDPYPNESMTNYGALEEDDLETTYGKILTEINGLEVGKASTFEDDSYYYILIKGDVTERSAEYAADEENHSNILYQMKSDDYQKNLDDWVSKITFDVNDKAIDRYTVEKIYNIQNGEE
ncbi:MAG: hypothetical protein K2F81_01315 [Ruminococcus sp.]|nr:hypothetical protein [Ruminococcus sp.]